MSPQWFIIVFGIVLILYGGGVLFKDRLLEWARKKDSVKLVAIASVIVGAFMIYTGVFILWIL